MTKENNYYTLVTMGMCGYKMNIPKGSAVPNKTKVGEITRAQLEDIAKIKMNDLNATTMEAAVEMIKGSCRAMGVTVKEG